MVVDHERAWLRLKEKLLTQRSWGTRQLFEAMAELEVENEVPESAEGFDARPLRSRKPDEPAREEPAHAGVS